jgi:hypothetical protein
MGLTLATSASRAAGGVGSGPGAAVGESTSGTAASARGYDSASDGRPGLASDGDSDAEAEIDGGVGGTSAGATTQLFVVEEDEEAAAQARARVRALVQAGVPLSRPPTATTAVHGATPPAGADDAGGEKDPDAWPAMRVFSVPNTEGFIEEGRKTAKVKRDLSIVGLGLPPVARTLSGWPAVNSPVLRALAGKPDGATPQWGLAYEYFGGGAQGEAACRALHAL